MTEKIKVVNDKGICAHQDDESRVPTHKSNTNTNTINSKDKFLNFLTLKLNVLKQFIHATLENNGFFYKSGNNFTYKNCAKMIHSLLFMIHYFIVFKRLFLT